MSGMLERRRGAEGRAGENHSREPSVGKCFLYIVHHDRRKKKKNSLGVLDILTICFSVLISQTKGGGFGLNYISSPQPFR